MQSEKKRNKPGLIFSFIKHYIEGNSRYGIHSPFVYNLLTECVYSGSLPADYRMIEEQRKKLESDKRIIEVSDLGDRRDDSAEGVMQKRSISAIAKKSVKSRRQSALLYRLAKYFECYNILELGTCFGITTSYLSWSLPGVVVNTIEGCPQVAGIAKSVFEALNLKNVRLHVGNIDEILIPVLNNTGRADLVFLDANHTRDATLEYFNIVLDYTNENSVFIIDDIHRSAGMEYAWREICDHRSVSSTIDLFYMGLVFFRKGLSKESFVIRY